MLRGPSSRSCRRAGSSSRHHKGASTMHKVDLSGLRGLAERVRATSMPPALIADELDQVIGDVTAQVEAIEDDSTILRSRIAKPAPPAAAPSPKRRVSAKTK